MTRLRDVHTGNSFGVIAPLERRYRFGGREEKTIGVVDFVSFHSTAV